MTTISIAVSKLVHSPRNVRQPGPDDDVTDLEESILEFGLLNPLTAHPMPRGRLGVFAGGRRLLALQRLIARDALPKTHEVDVTVRDEADLVLTEMSFAENAVRVSLPAVTEFKTYARLIEEGADITAVAHRYQVTELHVKQRMRLGQLHADILTALEAEHITLDMAKAYAATTDQALQKRVFDQRHAHVYEIRAALKRDLVNAGVDRMLELVGDDAYAAAGGRIEPDLFMPGESRVLDLDLLKGLYDAQLAAAVAALKLPGNVTLQFSADGVGISVEVTDNPTDEQQARMRELDGRLDAIDDELNAIAEWDDDGPGGRWVALAGENEDKVRNLTAEKTRLVDELNETVDGLAWPEGPLIAMASIRNGGLHVVGYYRPMSWRAPDHVADAGKVIDPPQSSSSATTEPTKRVANVWEPDRQNNGTVIQPEAVVREEHGLSRDAAEVVRSCRRQTLSAMLLADDEGRGVAEDYLVFVLARGVISGDAAAELGVHGLPRHEYDPPIAREDLAGQPAAAVVTAARERVLAFDWMREVDPVRAFMLYMEAPVEQTREAFAYVAALMLTRTMNAPGYQVCLHDVLGAMLDAGPERIREQWTPDQQFFERLPKARRLDAIREAVGPTIAGRFAQYGNEGLTQAAALVMEAGRETRSRYGMTGADVEAARRWVPEYMAFRDPDNLDLLIGGTEARQVEEQAA